MKTITILILSIMPALWAAAQTSVPAVDVRSTDGKMVSTADILQPGAPIMLVFWKSNDNKCCENLETLEDIWSSTMKDQGIRMVVICIDCNGSWTHVKPLVEGNAWDFESYVDVNGDLKRSMNVGEGSCTMLFDHDQNLLGRYDAASIGSQDYICENFIHHLETAIPIADLKQGR